MDFAAVADRLYDDLEVDHRRVLAEVLELVERPEVRAVPDLLGRALRVLGLARLKDGDVPGALAALDRAAASVASKQGRAEIQMSRVGPLAEMGRLEEASRAAAFAVENLTGVARARAVVQQTVLDFRMTGDPGLVPRLATAERTLERAGEKTWLVRLWTNRAHMEAFLGQNEAADRDAARAAEHSIVAGSITLLRGLLVMRAELAAERGDLVIALRFLDQLDGLSEEPDGTIDAHRSAIYRQAQLLDEAADAAERATGWLGAREFDLGHAESLLALAEIQLERGEWEAAAEAARDARVRFQSLAVEGWADYASMLWMEAEVRRGRRPVDDPSQPFDLADSVARHGMPAAAAVAVLRLMDALEVDGLGDPRARNWLVRAVRLGRVDLAVHARALAARSHRDSGRRSNAFRSVRMGMAAFESHQAALGATELRARAGRLIVGLGSTALELAETGRPADLLRWMERTRAGSLALPPVRAPDDEELRSILAQLRAVERRIERGEAALMDRRRQLESAVRRRARLVDGANATQGGLTMAGLRSALDGAALVAVDVIGDRVVAVGVAGRRTERWDVGSVVELDEINDRMRFATQRLVMAASPASAAAARSSLKADGALLFERLLAPLGTAERIVLSPPSRFHAMPFSVLPIGGSLAVAPSVRMWVRAKTTTPAAGNVALVAGVGLEHARDEVEELGAIHPDAVKLQDDDATVGAALEVMDGARIAHFATHGRIRTDNSQFSQLVLADGGLNVFQIQALETPPSTVVLSACQVGRSSVQAGNELVGLATGLLAAGSRSVVASVVDYPDSVETIEAMVALHEGLRRGSEASEALAEARATGLPAALALVCFGV